MLKQLAQLSIEADGRYATAAELQFLKDYLQSAEQRISAYEYIRDAEASLIEEIEAEKRSLDPNLFRSGNKDITDICRRDMVDVLRCSAAATLFNDLDRLRVALLLWYQTIVKAFDYSRNAGITYRIIQEVVKRNLPPEEANLALPALQLNHLILSNQ